MAAWRAGSGGKRRRIHAYAPPIQERHVRQGDSSGMDTTTFSTILLLRYLTWVASGDSAWFRWRSEDKRRSGVVIVETVAGSNLADGSHVPSRHTTEFS